MLHRKRTGTWQRARSIAVGLMIVLLVLVPLATSYAGEGVGSYSGDDAYDPAAGGQPERSIAAADTCSGPDPYDPASGCHPELSLLDVAPGNSADNACGLSADEIASRKALRIPGGLSGDDAYDPAAGGTPELSLLPFAQDPGLITACMPGAFGN
jgi:hypothetical protein